MPSPSPAGSIRSIGSDVRACSGPRRLHGLPRPGPVWGAYPMRAPEHGPHRAWLAAWRQRLAQPEAWGARQVQRLLSGVHAHGQALRAMGASALPLMAQRVRVEILARGLGPAQVALALAVVAEVARRELGLSARDTQLRAAAAMLRNSLVEMGTGEGKTLVAVLVAATGALAGMPVHVLTSNDYLARRDAEQLRPVFAALGLRVGCVQASDGPDARRAAYACDVTYATAREVAFDHLRDRLAATTPDAQPVLRGLCMAVLDEADSVLIDEASMPLILSQQVPDEDVQRWRLALFMARQLSLGEQAVEAEPGRWLLTESGRRWLSARADHLGSEWQLQRFREDLIHLALAALHGFQRDVHYVVHDDEIQIVDVHTGRRAEGRTWSRGLHQLIALKEGLQPAAASRTLMQMSYQRFFPRYVRLCGQSGTLWEAREELMAVYGLPVVRIGPHQPSRRLDLGTSVHADAASQWAAVAARVRELHAQGRPVLVGTGSVADSQALSAVLRAQGLVHQVLHASQDAFEAQVVAAAGAAGAITVATQMAGRGTDIHIDDALAERGGLHVICAGLQSARRVDRQLAGRCARRGQAGSHERMLALDDEGWRPIAPPAALRALAGLLRRAASPRHRGLTQLANRAGGWLAEHVQRTREGHAARLRWAARQAEEAWASELAWSGHHPWDPPA